MILKTTHLMRKVVYTLTGTISGATLRSRTTAPLPAAAIRGCAAAAYVAPLALGMNVGGV